MATAPFTIDITTPGDSDVINTFPAENRTNMEVIRDYLGTEHDAASGHHKIPLLTEVQRDAVSNWVAGSILYNTDDEGLEVVESVGPFVFKSIAGLETGIFTPVLNFDGATTGITYTTQNGQYTKIGNVCFFSLGILLSSKGSATGDAHISGLPFDVGSQVCVCEMSALSDLSAGLGDSSVYGRLDANLIHGEISLRQTIDGGTEMLEDSDFSNTSAFRLTGFFFV